jgi:hypothetical protein
VACAQARKRRASRLSSWILASSSGSFLRASLQKSMSKDRGLSGETSIIKVGFGSALRKVASSKSGGR